MEILVKNFCQMVLVFFWGTKKRNGIELYHLQNTGKFFAFSRHEAWHESFWWKQEKGNTAVPQKVLLFFGKISTLVFMVINLLTFCWTVSLYLFQQALASGGFPIAVPLQANTLNTAAQPGLSVNG